MPDELLFETAHVGRRVLFYDATDSTNDRAAELAADPANAGTVVAAGRQTAGRGQYGRSWQSPPGASLLLSALLFPPPALRRPALLTAWAAVSVAGAVLRTTGLQARVKWPNDVLLGGKKVCGILIESRLANADDSAPDAGTRNLAVVAGIGLNVNQSADDFERLGLPQATSLAAATGARFETRDLLELVVKTLDAEYGRLVGGDVATLEACWKWRVGLLGKRVTAGCADGSEVCGRLREMGFGGLELEQPDGSVRVLAPEAVRSLR